MPPDSEWGPWTSDCAGPIAVDGDVEPVYIVFNPLTVRDGGARARVSKRGVQLGHNARLYFARSCDPQAKFPSNYVAWSLVGKALSFTVDLSNAGCGCNVAAYLVAMRQSSQPGSCGGDWYCDANAVCGVRCEEVDLAVANTHAFHATAHSGSDSAGQGAGIGGDLGDGDSEIFRPALTRETYGPDATSLIDASRPFRVTITFAANAAEAAFPLASVSVRLDQHDLGWRGAVNEFEMCSAEYARSMTAALAAGMTPVLSFWSSGDLGWFQAGACDGSGDVDACKAATPSFSAFTIRDAEPSPRPPAPPPYPSPRSPPPPPRPPPSPLPPPPLPSSPPLIDWAALVAFETTHGMEEFSPPRPPSPPPPPYESESYAAPALRDAGGSPAPAGGAHHFAPWPPSPSPAPRQPPAGLSRLVAAASAPDALPGMLMLAFGVLALCASWRRELASRRRPDFDYDFEAMLGTAMAAQALHPTLPSMRGRLPQPARRAISPPRSRAGGHSGHGAVGMSSAYSSVSAVRRGDDAGGHRDGRRSRERGAWGGEEEVESTVADGGDDSDEAYQSAVSEATPFCARSGIKNRN